MQSNEAYNPNKTAQCTCTVTAYPEYLKCI